MRRAEKAVTDLSQIRQILSRAAVCHIAFAVPGEAPYILPLNYGFLLTDDGELTLFFHGALQGRKIDLIRQHVPVGFCIDIAHGLEAAQTPCQYGYRFESVIGEGICTLVEDPQQKADALTHLMRMQTQKNIPVSPKQAQSCAVFTIVSKSFTAKCSL